MTNTPAKKSKTPPVSAKSPRASSASTRPKSQAKSAPAAANHTSLIPLGRMKIKTRVTRKMRSAINMADECFDWRSEEHTSELQSRENLVCRLLLEKKKQERRKLQRTLTTQ